MDKKQAIKEAYGELWETVKDYVYAEGYVLARDVPGIRDMIGNAEMIIDAPGRPAYRPKSLKGIEDNNGWKRIDSEADLPKMAGTYHVIVSLPSHLKGKTVDKPRLDILHVMPGSGKVWKYYNGLVTHWQLIVEPEKPLY